MAFSADTKTYPVGSEQQQQRTGTSHPNISNLVSERLTEWVCSLNRNPHFRILSFVWMGLVLFDTCSLPPCCEYPFTLQQCGTQPTRMNAPAIFLPVFFFFFLFFTQIVSKSPFLCVKRSPIRYDFVPSRKLSSIKCKHCLSHRCPNVVLS